MMTMRVMETSTLTSGRITPPSFSLAPPSRITILAPPSSQAAPRLAAPPPPLRLLLRPPSLLLLLDLLLLKQGVLLAAVTVHPTIVLAHLQNFSLLGHSTFFRRTFQNPHLMFWAGHWTAAKQKIEKVQQKITFSLKVWRLRAININWKELSGGVGLMID